jgi:hypothetical protein
MSYANNLFLDSPVALEAISREVGDLLGIAFQRVDSGEGPTYQYNSPDCFLSLRGGHGMVNDRDMKFEDYAYQLEVLSRRTSDSKRDRDKCSQFARRLFEKLKITGRHRLLLVENLQKKLDSFEPESAKE